MTFLRSEEQPPHSPVGLRTQVGKAQAMQDLHGNQC